MITRKEGMLDGPWKNELQILSIMHFHNIQYQLKPMDQSQKKCLNFTIIGNRENKDKLIWTPREL